MRTLIGRLHRSEDGAARVGMDANRLVAVVCLAAVTLLSTEISSAFSYYAAHLARV